MKQKIRHRLEQITDSISDLLTKKPANTKEIERLLILTNNLLSPQKAALKSKDRIYENYCYILTSSIHIPREYRAYHSGQAIQSELVRKDDPWIDNLSTTNHVYFSIDLEEIVEDYILPRNRRYNTIYVADLRSVRNARVQISYCSETLWNDRIRTLVSFYKDYGSMKELLERYSETADYKYIEPFINKSKEELKIAMIDEIKNWINKCTISFIVDDLNEYKEKGWRYVLVPSPVQ